ncbi:MAG: hypothetical protein ACREN7_08790, partial [Candidatus Dormibacteria bacterium]
MYPVPGSRTASTATQISFQGVSAATLTATPLQVVGSESGIHLGRWVADSREKGASFYPAKPFVAGERVRVTA